jgi:hypothetical protein
MRITALIVTLAAAVATTATAQPGSRLSDVDYMQAARCRGLAGSEALGAMDTQAIDAMLKEQSHGRAAFIADKAGELRDNAVRSAKRADGSTKEKLIAERDGVCKRFLG